MANNSYARIRVYVDIDSIGPGMGPSGLGGLNANDPASGQSAGPTMAGNAQTLRIQDSTAVVPGTPGSYTVANFNTALSTIVTDIAGASGTPLITAAILAQINGWNSGSP